MVKCVAFEKIDLTPCLNIMLKVGLTGSIAVGKSFVTQVLAELGCFVLDADQTAREVVEPNTVGWQRIVESLSLIHI